MYVDICKYKRGSKTYSRSLLRESFREGGKVKHRTVANISHLPHQEILALRAALAGKTVPAEDVTDPKTMPMNQGPSIGAIFTLILLAKRIGIAAMVAIFHLTD